MLQVMVNAVGHLKKKKTGAAQNFNVAPTFASLEIFESKKSQKYQTNDTKEPDWERTPCSSSLNFFHVYLGSFLYLLFAFF